VVASRRQDSIFSSLPFATAGEIGAVGTRSEEAFRRHYAQIFRYLRRRLPSEHEAEELTQLVFADAARRLDQFKPGATPVLAWLYTVAQRRLSDRARALSRHQALAELDQRRLHEVGEREYGTNVAKALRAALERLPEPQRRVVVLKLLHGLSFAEIAERVDGTEAACKMRFARGLEAVRDEFEKEGIAP
jgi:RNA polymerase sigma-70 factor (ECF subfamily)